MAKVMITIEDKESIDEDTRISLGVETNIPFPSNKEDWTEAQYLSMVAVQAISDDINRLNPQILSVTSRTR